GCGRGHGHPCDRGRNRCPQPPARGLGVNLAFGTVGSRQPGHFEPGMVLQHLDESLSDYTGSAENADGNLIVHMSTWNFITSDAGIPCPNALSALLEVSAWFERPRARRRSTAAEDGGATLIFGGRLRCRLNIPP